MNTKLFISVAVCVAASVLMSSCSKEEIDENVAITNGQLTAVYSGHNYYMWDAAENYWSGHEWDATEAWQPKVNNDSNGNYPKSNADPRWYNEGSGAFEASVNPLFNQLPNANELGWYVRMGDPHWDDTTQWEAFGTTHTGGIWLKKLSVIAQENSKTLADFKLTDPNGKNLLTSSSDYYDYYDYYHVSPKSGKPADSEISKYFFLPALGYYHYSQLYNLGSEGRYWSSSATPSHSVYAYRLSFRSGDVYLGNAYRNYGFVAQPFE